MYNTIDSGTILQSIFHTLKFMSNIMLLYFLYADHSLWHNIIHLCNVNPCIRHHQYYQVSLILHHHYLKIRKMIVLFNIKFKQHNHQINIANITMVSKNLSSSYYMKYLLMKYHIYLDSISYFILVSEIFNFKKW